MQFDDVEGDELALSSSMTPKCTLEEGAFPKLSVITFSASTVPDILAFFTQPAFPLANLTVVWVHAPIVPDPSHVEALFADLLRAVPSMVDLSLGLLRLSYTGPSDLEDVKPLTLRTILPVTRWSSLRSFSVSHPRPISLTDDEVDAFARALHVDFEELLLNLNPLIATPPTLTLKAFLPVASRFRKLKELGLYFDATIVPPTSHLASRSFRARPRILGRTFLSTRFAALVVRHRRAFPRPLHTRGDDVVLAGRRTDLHSVYERLVGRDVGQFVGREGV